MFWTIENLDVNKDNIFGQYKVSNNKLSTVNSGLLYRQAYKNMVKDLNKDFLMPILCLWWNKNRIRGEKGSWPLMFTTLILNQQLRNQPIAWRLLGYLYDLSLIISESETKKMSNDLKYSRLRAMFRCILETFVDAQKEDTLSNIELMLGKAKEDSEFKNSLFLYHWWYARRQQNLLLLTNIFKQSQQALLEM